MKTNPKASADRTVPVIDLFAGPGGLGEGFSSCPPVAGTRFQIALSIEMEKFAHQTLQLRAFRRQFDAPPPEYWEFLRGQRQDVDLFRLYPNEAAAAQKEAQRITLSAKTAGSVRGLVAAALGGAKTWVLVGGPPCQAYSLVGRARNKGIAEYDADKDSRHVLYLEYLQLLAEHAPPVFVMENVKGLLSAKYRNVRMFDRIRADLQRPADAFERTRRVVQSRRSAQYRLMSVSPDQGLFPGEDPADFLLRAEKFGVPQARHRVIIVGVRSDVDMPDLRLARRPEQSVEAVIGDMPRVRSGVTNQDGAWKDLLRECGKRDWLKEVAPDVRRKIRTALVALKACELDRGGEFIAGHNQECPELGGWINHSTRAHILSDLERYLFASAFAAERFKSPTLAEFPTSLLPNHGNVDRAVASGHFSDRFRVQLSGRPSMTITSHISKDGHYYIHPDPTQCRSLTVREAARLQTFPEDYFFCGPRTAQYHQVGNAVPPRLARQIAALILPHLL